MEEVFILCPWNQVHDIARAFRDQFKHEQVPATVLASTTTEKQATGYMVIEWEEKVSDHFLEQLHINPDILDFAVY